MGSLRCFLLGLLAHSLHWTRVASQSRTCYFPDHTEAANFTECNASATQSSCCRDSEACLSNGYCLQQAGLANRVTRGACTDSTFSNPGCPSLCTDVSTENSMSFYLARDTKPNGDFCCYPGYNVTSQECVTSAGGPSEPFEIPAGTVIIDRSSGATLTYNYTGSTNITTATATVTATSKSDSNMTAVAVGIAVPLGVCLAAALAGCAFLFHLLRKERQRKAASDTSGLAVPLYEEHNTKDYMQSPSSAPSNGHSLSYSSIQNPQPEGYAFTNQPAPAPFQAPSGFVAEAPNEREISLADSTPIYKRM